MNFLTIKDYFLLIECEKVLPEITAEIPGIGTVKNLYEFGYKCLSDWIKYNENVSYHFAQKNCLSIIFTYLIDNNLIQSTKRPEPFVDYNPNALPETLTIHLIN